MNKSEKVALVTGAGSGIGMACARLFSKNGFCIAATARRRDSLKTLEQESANVKAFHADLLQIEQVQHLVDDVISTLGRLDVLVNAAGIIRTGSIENTSLQVWDEMMQINVRAIFWLMQKAVPHLEKTRGNIVSVSSVNGLRSFPGVLAYCVSKAALDQLTRCSALELAAKGIRVNAVNPGVTRTNLHRSGGMEEGQYAAFLERSKTTHPLGRVGQPEEIAELIFFLASEKAGWITGATYSIDGGRALTCAR
ncbi:MAG TPA: SDR family oxidoreductase [Acidobacteriota bacterium]|jgi:NAD(P)-dependent dehydrogenase (short-subunit alcohol dehydrogenase family)|nr:SDR family oxidoreductase [Acidobacteriota bacterium]